MHRELLLLTAAGGINLAISQGHVFALISQFSPSQSPLQQSLSFLSPQATQQTSENGRFNAPYIVDLCSLHSSIAMPCCAVSSWCSHASQMSHVYSVFTAYWWVISIFVWLCLWSIVQDDFRLTIQQRSLLQVFNWEKYF